MTEHSGEGRPLEERRGSSERKGATRARTRHSYGSIRTLPSARPISSPARRRRRRTRRRRHSLRRGTPWPLPDRRALPPLAAADRRERGAQPAHGGGAARDLALRARSATPTAMRPHPRGGGAPRRGARDTLLARSNRLREEDRLVIAYRYFFDLSEAEMATALDCARGTVKSRLSRALGRLRDCADATGLTDDDLGGGEWLNDRSNSPIPSWNAHSAPRQRRSPSHRRRISRRPFGSGSRRTPRAAPVVAARSRHTAATRHRARPPARPRAAPRRAPARAEGHRAAARPRQCGDRPCHRRADPDAATVTAIPTVTATPTHPLATAAAPTPTSHDTTACFSARALGTQTTLTEAQSRVSFAIRRPACRNRARRTSLRAGAAIGRPGLTALFARPTCPPIAGTDVGLAGAGVPGRYRGGIVPEGRAVRLARRAGDGERRAGILDRGRPALLRLHRREWRRPVRGDHASPGTPCSGSRAASSTASNPPLPKDAAVRIAASVR